MVRFKSHGIEFRIWPKRESVGRYLHRLLSLIVVSGVGLAATPRPAADDPLLRLVRNEKYHAPTDSQIQSKQLALKTSLDRLHSHGATSSTGIVLAATLKLDQFSENLEAGKASIASCREFAVRLRGGASGLESPLALELREKLDHYLGLLAAEQEANPAETADTLRHLATDWIAYRQNPSAENLQAICDSYEWLVNHRQAAAATNWLDQNLSHPNQRFIITREFLLAALPKTAISQPLQVNQWQNGTHVTGSGMLTGKLDVRLPPSNSHGQVELAMHGTGQNQVRAVRGRATVWANTTINVAASQKLLLDNMFIARKPAEVRVSVRTHPHSASLGLRMPVLDRLAGNLALRAANQQTGSADFAAAQQAERQIQRAFEQQATDKLTAINRTIDEKFRHPLLSHGLLPRLAMQTSAEQLILQARFATSAQLGAPTAPPPVSNKTTGLISQTHESAINNVDSLFAGESIDAEDFRESIFERFSLLTPELAEERSHGDVSVLHLAAEHPLQIRFQQGQIMFTLRLRGFEAEGSSYHGSWTVKTSYRLLLKPQGITLERSTPIGVVAAANEECAALARILPQFFVSSAASGKDSFFAEVLRHRHLRVIDLRTENGWLTIALAKDNPAVQAAAVPALQGSSK